MSDKNWLAGLSLKHAPVEQEVKKEIGAMSWTGPSLHEATVRAEEEEEAKKRKEVEEEYNPVWCSIDIERTGNSLKTNGMIQIGATIMESKTRRELASFKVQLNIPEGKGWEERCVTEFWDKHLELQPFKQSVDNKEGVEPEIAMTQFKGFVEEGFRKYARGDLKRWTFVTDIYNDASWIDLYLAEYLNDHPPLHSFFGKFKDLIQTDSYAYGRSGIKYEEAIEIAEKEGWFSREKSCIKRRKITEKPSASHTHDALDDARYIAQMHDIIMYSPDPAPPRKISYVEASVDQNSYLMIKEICKQKGIEVTVNDMHCTLLYSTYRPGFQVNNRKYPISAKVTGMELFANKEGIKNVLVVTIECPLLVERHKQLMRVKGATYDFPEFKPHITIAYNCNNPPLIFPEANQFPILYFTEEKYEEFQED